MKTNKKKNNRSLLNLHFLKYQIYKKTPRTNFDKFVQNSLISFKSILNVIYLYDKSNKNILFVGFNVNKKLQNQTFHKFIKKDLFFSVFKNNGTIPKLVVFDKILKKDLILINYLRNKGIIVISFETENLFNYECYSTYNFLNNKHINKFYLFLIFTILTKTK